MKKFIAVSLISIMLPMLVAAQTTETTGGDNFFVKIQNLINQSIGVLLGIATLVFLVGVIQYVIAGGDEKKTSAAKTYMLYGIIGLVVMVAAWGIVNLIVTTLGLQTTKIPDLPHFGGEAAP